MLKDVAQYIAKHPDRKPELELLRGIMADLPLQETLKWGVPVYVFESKNIIGLGAYKAYVGIWFYQGVYLSDPNKVLVNAQEGKTKAMRQWRFNSIDEIDAEAVKAYVLEAIENQKQGLELIPERGGSLQVGPELKQILTTDQQLNAAFNQLTAFKQKEFAAYIEEAKREATKLSRIEKIKPLILAGEGLNDKYRN